MDTAAAAAAAVVVDLSSEGSGKSKLLSSPIPSPGTTGPSIPHPSSTLKPKPVTGYTLAVAPSAAACSDQDQAGSTVESVADTPPPTPPSSTDRIGAQRCPGNDVIGTGAGAAPEPLNAADAHPMPLNGGLLCKEAITAAASEHGQSGPTSTSSANASTTPMSALLTPAAAAPATVTISTEQPSAVAPGGAAPGTPATTTTTTTTSTSHAPPVGAAPSSSSSSSLNSVCNSRSRSSSSSVPSTGPLLQWQDMPQYLQFNPYVLRGYRPLQTFKGCLLSLFYWHNETINILTHAIPIIYILAIVPGLMPWDSGYKFLSFCHVFGSVAPWCGSFVYHLFMNIEKGENVYYTLLKLDMVGIWVSQSFGALPLVTATTLCFTPVLKWLIISSYCLLSLWGLYKALTASSPWQRRLCFALPFGMRSILTFLRIRGMVGGSHMALSHVYLQVEVDGVSILGGAIGAMRIPEKWFPGVVDFYLNSHNIMHVLVVVAVYSMHKATIKDFEWMSTQTCNSFANVTETAIGHGEL
ncbi:progestin and adipoQ receptor family member 4 isoform X1 [Drosophila pseudoobscura]|uniref:Progestin and adipoQ receptor family member 4 isoform X1 n=1 Tax=Drosophila pseudoobscura pseudoobscura TaxID=46245 RepID=A0A6I8V5L9_DROPS|nr:progestin and adipoQ receptor family member 4 isoform X1 [Drosophila pseudoobscura]